MVTGEASLTDRTVRLGRALQGSGVAVSLSEMVDAVTALGCTDLSARIDLREALRATMVKDARHYAVFERAFDHYFPPRLAATDDATQLAASDPDAIAAAVAGGHDLGAIAQALVDEFGGLDGEQRGERHHLHRIFHGADIARLMSRVRVADPTLTPAMIRACVDDLKRLIGADVRARLAVDELISVDGELYDIDFLQATRDELVQMRAAVRPLARKLAARLARRRRHHTGRANVRRTVRRSLGTGGVPLDVVHDRPRAHRPELFVLCDISGSVADFSLFTLTLMSALSSEIARTRSFVFVDAVDEVTELLDSTRHGIEPWSLLRNTNVIGDDGHSHYGQALEQFWRDTAERDVRRNATILVTGDARTNHRASGADTLGRIAERARRVYWLNPEPRSEWDTFDSEVAAYLPHCAAMFEVRNLRQLVDCVEQLF